MHDPRGVVYSHDVLPRRSEEDVTEDLRELGWGVVVANGVLMSETSTEVGHEEMKGLLMSHLQLLGECN